MACGGDVVALRDSQRPENVVLVAKHDFAVFVQGVKEGEFDDLVS